MKRLAKLIYRMVLVALAVGLTLISGVLHGHLRHRWGHPDEMLRAASLLESIPQECGDWQMHSSEQLSEQAVQMLECVSYVYRTYVNRRSGEVVTVAVLLGPPGPMAAHTPEVCYSARDYRLLHQRARVALPDSRDPDERFWALTLQSKDVHARRLRVYYAWSDGGAWSASTHPRVSFGARPLLYKVQLAGHAIPSGAEEESAEPCLQFLQDFVPAMDEFLIKCPRRGFPELIALLDIRKVTRGN